MKLIKIIIIILIFLNFSSLKSEENDQNEENKIAKNIRCLICQGQSIYDSQSDFAISMKLVISKKINDGLSEEEIYDYLINKYGQWITYNPKFNQKTFILWLMPVLLFLIGGVIILRKLILQK